ncbi:hypothetical protein DB347_17710 [Opitutaceae bacterium EW11]|nr:hypothetical protein DB347_17710 [Opitutaceae bacterium EW11]
MVWILEREIELAPGERVDFQGVVFVEGQWLPQLWDAVGGAHSCALDDFDIDEPVERAWEILPDGQLTDETSSNQREIDDWKTED